VATSLLLPILEPAVSLHYLQRLYIACSDFTLPAVTLHYLQRLYITRSDFTLSALTFYYLQWLYITCSDFTVTYSDLYNTCSDFTLPAVTLHTCSDLYIAYNDFTLPAVTLHYLQWSFVVWAVHDVKYFSVNSTTSYFDACRDVFCRVDQNHIYIYTVKIRYSWQEIHQIYGHIQAVIYSSGQP